MYVESKSTNFFIINQQKHSVKLTTQKIQKGLNKGCSVYVMCAFFFSFFTYLNSSSSAFFLYNKVIIVVTCTLRLYQRRDEDWLTQKKWTTYLCNQSTTTINVLNIYIYTYELSTSCTVKREREERREPISGRKHKIKQWLNVMYHFIAKISK